MELIFDLDDTLYPERQYVLSALEFAGEELDRRFGVKAAGQQLWQAFVRGSGDPIGEIWDAFSLPESPKPGFVEAMRAHLPDIALRDDAQEILEKLRKSGRGFSILTDGRSITQRAKIKALGCDDAKLISISEEVGFTKVDVRRFQAVEDELVSASYCYVGDNPSKDFVVPNRLGWHTVMLSGSADNIHPQDLQLDGTYLPKQIVRSLSELECF